MNLYGYVVYETVELLLVTFPYGDVIFSEDYASSVNDSDFVFIDYV